MAQLAALRTLVTNIQQTRREKWGDLSGYLFMAPLVLLWLVFGGYPYIRGILITLQDYRAFEPQTWPFFNSFVGLQNFRELLGDELVWRGLWAALLFFVSWFPASFILSLGTAVVLNRVRVGWLSSVHRVLMSLPWVIPLAAAMPMWGFIYEPNFGYLNHLLRDVLGIWQDPPSWGSDYFWYWPAIGIAAIWRGFGFYTLLFLVGLYNIPKELYEASELDGANSWRQFWHVELPGLRNILVLLLITSAGFLGAGVVEMMTFGQGPGHIGKTAALRAWEVAFKGAHRLGYGSAINLFVGFINLALVALVFKFFRSVKA
jgi:ABC-type sugar transport system permease subunit